MDINCGWRISQIPILSLKINTLTEKYFFVLVVLGSCQNIPTTNEERRNGEQIRVCIDERPVAAESDVYQCPRGTGLRLFRCACPCAGRCYRHFRGYVLSDAAGRTGIRSGCGRVRRAALPGASRDLRPPVGLHEGHAGCAAGGSGAARSGFVPCGLWSCGR